MQSKPARSEMPRKNKIISLFALVLVAISIVGILILQSIGSGPIGWPILIPFGIGMLLLAYNSGSIISQRRKKTGI